MADGEVETEGIAEKWEKLENWKRWLIGEQIVIGAILLVIGGAWMCLSLMWGGKEDLGIDLFKYIMAAYLVFLAGVTGYYFGSHQTQAEAIANALKKYK